MGITMTVTGRLGKPERPSFFIPKGALTHHLPAGQAVVAFPLVRPCALRGGCGSCGSLQTMLPRLRFRSSLSVRRDRCTDPSACENLHPAALSQRQGESKMIALLSLLRKRNRKNNTEVIATGNIPSGSESHQQRHGPIRMRSIGLYELFHHL